MVQDMLGVCEAKNWTKTNECCKLERMGTKECVKDGRGTGKETKTWRIEGERKYLRERSIRGW